MPFANADYQAFSFTFLNTFFRYLPLETQTRAMKKLIFFCSFLTLCTPFYFTQTFYNGSFENDTVAICTYSLDNPNFNIQMPHVNAFGTTDNGYFPNSNFLNPTGRISLNDSGCYVIPVHGKWCIGLRSLFGPTYDAVAIELDAPLDSGTTYYVSFYCYGNKSFQNFDCDLALGYSPYNFVPGTTVHTVTANYQTWKNSQFSFVATDTSRYITVRTIPGYNSWIQIDNFEISKNPIPVGLEKYPVNAMFRMYPNPATNFVTLDFADFKQNLIVNICNELGQVVLRDTINDPTKKQIDLSNFPNGFYTLHINDRNSLVCKKIVIAR